MCLTVRYQACATKVRDVALINLVNRYLFTFRHLDLCCYTDKHLCLKTGTYGMVYMVTKNVQYKLFFSELTVILEKLISQYSGN